MALASPVRAQDPAPVDHSAHVMPAEQTDPHVAGDRWMVMYDGVLFGTFNHQGGPRGGRELVATNWVMAMASRRAGAGQLQLTGMASIDPWTAPGQGYRLLFQSGETYTGRPIVDHQHPHDLLMQAAIAWRVPTSATTALTLSAAPVGEPALGPTAFMHRPSAAENVSAPLAHHTLDSTHLSMGVLSAGFDIGRFTVESSVFRGAEPDDTRWDLVDWGALDSWSARVWYAPLASWRLQASHGLLTDPEPLEPGRVRRTTASVDWWRPRPDGFFAATVAYGRNDRVEASQQALLAEATMIRGRLSSFGRVEALQVETALLAGHDDVDHARLVDHDRRDVVSSVTLGAVWNLTTWRGFEGGVGADVTFARAPDALEATYTPRPVSFHVFVRVRPPVPAMGRMWNMRMGRVPSPQEHGHGAHGKSGEQ